MQKEFRDDEKKIGDLDLFHLRPAGTLFGVFDLSALWYSAAIGD